MSKVFSEGMIVKRNDKAPEFVTCNLSFKVEEFINFLRTHEKSGWVNLTVKKGREGKYYSELDTWEKAEGSTPAKVESKPQAPEPVAPIEEPFKDDDLPF
jgi:hypothetical protein